MALKIYNYTFDKIYKVSSQGIRAEFYPRNKYSGTVYDDCMAIFEGKQCLIELTGTTVHVVIEEFMRTLPKKDRKILIEHLENLTELEEEGIL